MIKSIVHIISANDVFGPEKTTINECKWLQNKGWNAAIINIWKNNDVPIKNKIEKAGIQYYFIKSTKKLDSALIKKLKNIILTSNCQLVHSHGYKSDLFAYLATRNTPIKRVTTIHGWTSEDFKVRIYEKLQAFIWRFFDRVFSVSNKYRKVAVTKGVPEEKLFLLYNGIIIDNQKLVRDTSKKRKAKSTLNLDPNSISIGIVGRLSIEKDHELFINVASSTLKKFQDVQFVIVGDGIQRSQLEAQTSSLGISSKVKFVGHIDDMSVIYDALDIVAICSKREGLPNVLLESMLNYIPVVSLAVGGVPEVIDENQGGIIVKNATVKCFSESLLKLLEDENYREELGVLGNQRIQYSFSFDQRMNTIIHHYETLVNEVMGIELS